MKVLEILIGSIALCVSSLPLILLLLTLQQNPSVPKSPPLDQAQIREIQQLMIDHDPRQLLASDYQEVRLTENELSALTTYVKNTNPTLAAVNIHTDLRQAGASIRLSIPIAMLGLQRYVNLDLRFRHVDDALALASVDAGALSIPAPLLAPLREAVNARLAEDQNYQLVASFFASLDFQSITEDNVVIVLNWQGDNLRQLEDQARQAFVSAREARRLKYFHDKLAATLAELPADIRRIGLNDLLRPLFLYASLNSAGGADPVAENRAIFIVLTAYLTELELPQLIGTDTVLAEPRRVRIVIENREDLAQHVVGSAAIAASAGAAMAEVISIYKEVHDSRFRTGFSFTDIAANQAGSLLGMLATRSDRDARLFQDIIKDSQASTDYLPPVGTYDGMTEAEFIEAYGSRDSEAYQARLAEITDRIATSPIYARFGN